MSVPSWAEQYIEKINGSGPTDYFFKDVTTFDLVQHSGYYVNCNANDYSWGNTRDGYSIIESDYQSSTMYCYERLNFDIRKDESTGNYSFSFTGYRTGVYMEWEGDASGYCAQVKVNYLPSSEHYYMQAMVLPSSTQFRTQVTISSPNQFTTLEQMLQYIAIVYRNVNIYVDGECWACVDNPTYDFESVDEISGNDKVQSLSTIVDVNNGELVETTDTTKFTLNNSSNVYNIVRDIINNW